jgi:hypothetical protein
MAPTPFVLLLVALFWTLPASAAVLVYRRHGGSLESVKRTIRRPLNRLMAGLRESSHKTPSDAPSAR